MKFVCALLLVLTSLALAETFSTLRMQILNGKAILLVDSPPAVNDAVEAANRIVGKPYKPGGGHGPEEDDGYDCSGATSYVLRAAGVLEGALSSSGFKEFGEPGPGEWISIYHRPGHVFLVIAGARFDTTDSANVGPGWREADRFDQGFVVRHPKGM